MPDSAPVELLRSLAVLAEPPTPALAPITEALGIDRPPTASEYSDLFLFQLYPYASVHLGAEGMMGGEARSRIAGFWQAVGHVPPAEPDHLAALLGLHAALASAESESAEPGRSTEALEGTEPGPVQEAGSARMREAEAALMREGCRTLLWEHLAPWIFAYLARVEEIAPPAYRRWARLTTDVCAAEVERLGPPPEVQPGALADLDPVADPRREGTDAFLGSLLAPARSGILITRSDLATVARSADVGLRAGERRYALEHLLAQDAGAVLNELAGEARRQGDAHRARADRLGVVATSAAERAGKTAELLEGLGSDVTVAPLDGTTPHPVAATERSEASRAGTAGVSE